MIPNPYPGKFFAFEGGDGCGKTEQLTRAHTWLSSANFDECSVVITKEPGKDRPFGKKIYEDLFTPGGLHETDPLGFQTWYACDSKEHMQDIVIPALRVGSVVLSDRFRPSLVFGAKTPDDIKDLMAMNQAILGEHFIWPDAVFIFDVSVATAISRSQKKGRQLDGHENRIILERVLANYRYFSKHYPSCHLIDAERRPEEIFEDVTKIISSIIWPSRQPRI